MGRIKNMRCAKLLGKLLTLSRYLDRNNITGVYGSKALNNGQPDRACAEHQRRLTGLDTGLGHGMPSDC
jgi:hypothetical protein